MKPSTRPGQSLDWVKKIILQHSGRLEKKELCLVFVRGYYRDSMGKPGVNDRGIYDDACFLVGFGDHQVFASFNANTDPSVYRKRVAVLKEGVWWWKKGKHGLSRPNPYWALRQARGVTVIRDGAGEDRDGPPRFWINIHKGTKTNTSSLGCLTIYPTQYDSFLKLVYDYMERYQIKEIPGIVVEQQG